MNRRFIFLFLSAAFVALLPFRSPAPLVYAPGEGWYYEPAGATAKWTRARAKDQLEVAEEAFKNKDYSTAMHAASRVAESLAAVGLRAARGISYRPLPRNERPGRSGV